MICTLSSCKMYSLKMLLAFLYEKIILTIRLLIWWETRNAERGKNQPLWGPHRFKSTLTLNTHCTFLRAAGYRAHLKTNHQQMMICRGITVHFYKCSPRPTHKTQNTWDWSVKTYAIIVMWKTLQYKKDAQYIQWDSQTLHKPEKKAGEEDWKRGHACYCLNNINIGRVWFMELANLKGWNYFLDIKKINPVLANLHFKRQKGIICFFIQ